jgi:hypothetical protein
MLSVEKGFYMPAPIPPFLRVYSNHTVNKDTSCWIWNGHTFNSGYGCLKVFGKMKSTHRLSYELYYGKIPEGKEVKHACDNKLCINPEHLSVGTHQENMNEASDRGLMLKGDNHPSRINGSQNKGSKLKTSVQVCVMGCYFGSIKRAEDHFNLGSGSVRYWLNTGNSKARVLTREEYEKHVGKC